MNSLTQKLMNVLSVHLIRNHQRIRWNVFGRELKNAIALRNTMKIQTLAKDAHPVNFLEMTSMVNKMVHVR